MSLSYLRNVTFSINSAEDIDIMIAPNFKDTIDNPNAKTRMFRAQKFNSPSGSYRLYELTPSNGGYQFLDPDPGNNQPLTFRYYNNTDTDTANDYAVFVSKNYVFSSKIPPSPPVRTPNYLLPGGGLSLTNINPNSNNNGEETGNDTGRMPNNTKKRRTQMKIKLKTKKWEEGTTEDWKRITVDKNKKP